MQDLQTWPISQSDVLAAAQAGRLEVSWRVLVPGLWVQSDAAILDGHRVPVTAATALAIAELWEAELPEPETWDVRHAAAEIRVIPEPQDYRIMHTVRAVSRFGVVIDRQVAAQLPASSDPNPIVSCPGKIWASTPELLRRQKAGERSLACNYGLFTPTGPYASVSGKFRLWQQPGYRHNADHWDYSQTLSLVLRASRDLSQRQLLRQAAMTRPKAVAAPGAQMAAAWAAAAAVALLGVV